MSNNPGVRRSFCKAQDTPVRMNGIARAVVHVELHAEAASGHAGTAAAKLSVPVTGHAAGDKHAE